MHGHKDIPSANPLFSGILWAHPILHVSRIRVNWFQYLTSKDSNVSCEFEYIYIHFPASSSNVRIARHFSTFYNKHHIISQCTKKKITVTTENWILQKQENCLLQHRSNNQCVCSLLWIMIHLWQNIYFDYSWHFRGWWQSSKKAQSSTLFFFPDEVITNSFELSVCCPL